MAAWIRLFMPSMSPLVILECHQFRIPLLREWSVSASFIRGLSSLVQARVHQSARNSFAERELACFSGFSNFLVMCMENGRPDPFLFFPCARSGVSSTNQHLTGLQQRK